MNSQCTLCLAGGGVLGAAYEIGAMAAVEEHLEANGLQLSFDRIVGVSAGAAVASLLAQGVSARTLYKDFASGLLSPGVAAGLTSMGPRFGRTRLLQGALRALYAKRGLTNRFSELPAPLLIPAVDVDTAERRVFGGHPIEQATIAEAVAASCAMPPFFDPLTIDGRRFVDGAFVSPLYLDVAIGAGATKILAVDPIAPTRSSPGSGPIALLHGQCARIEHAARSALELAHARLAAPHVRVVCFRPSRRETYAEPPMSWGAKDTVMKLGFELTARQLDRGDARALFDETEVARAG
jgi:NTE family protein